VRRIFGAIALAFSICSLTACSLFYPNWGATEMPTPTSSSSASASETPSPTPTVNPTDSASPTPTDRTVAELQIMDATPDATAGTLSVIAQVNNVTEANGTCALTIKAGGVTKKFAAVKAEPNAAFTQCFAIVVPLAGLASGEATAQVTYDSPTATGKSNYFAVTIP